MIMRDFLLNNERNFFVFLILIYQISQFPNVQLKNEVLGSFQFHYQRKTLNKIMIVHELLNQLL